MLDTEAAVRRGCSWGRRPAGHRGCGPYDTSQLRILNDSLLGWGGRLGQTRGHRHLEKGQKKKRKKSPQRAPKIPASAFLFPEPGARGGPERTSVHGHRGEPRLGALHASTSLENTWSNALKAEFNRRGEKKKHPHASRGPGRGQRRKIFSVLRHQNALPTSAAAHGGCAETPGPR